MHFDEGLSLFTRKIQLLSLFLHFNYKHLKSDYMKRLLLTAFMFISAIMAFAQSAIQVQMHNVVAADEQFNVTFIIEGEDKPSDFTWTPGDDFQLLWGPQQGRSTSVQMINGKTTKSVQTTYSYVLRPVKPGKSRKKEMLRSERSLRGNQTAFC
jgi:hypothetical protein